MFTTLSYIDFKTILIVTGAIVAIVVGFMIWLLRDNDNSTYDL